MVQILEYWALDERTAQNLSCHMTKYSDNLIWNTLVIQTMRQRDNEVHATLHLAGYVNNTIQPCRFSVAQKEVYFWQPTTISDMPTTNRFHKLTQYHNKQHFFSYRQSVSLCILPSPGYHQHPKRVGNMILRLVLNGTEEEKGNKADGRWNIGQNSLSRLIIQDSY